MTNFGTTLEHDENILEFLHLAYSLTSAEIHIFYF